MTTIIKRAIDLFGGYEDGTFNSACFAKALNERLDDADNYLDGKEVAAYLMFRKDIEKVGDAHWKWKIWG